MPGSLREKRPGVWELRIFLGRDAAGRVKHRSSVFHGKKREAARELARLAAEVHSGDGEVQVEWTTNTTVNDAISAWERNGWEDLSPSTVRRYRSIWRVHVRDTIGRKRIKALGPYEVEHYFRQLKKQGQSEASIRQIRAFLHRSCRLARKWSGNRLPNPISGTELPDWALQEQRPQVRAPEPEEVRSLIRAARSVDSRLATFIRFMAATGARRGEVCALRWSDVDWKKSAVRLDEAIVADVGGARTKSPKNRSSIRTIALDRLTLDQLADLRAEQRSLAAASGVEVDDEAFVFSVDPSGMTPPHPDSMSHAFSRVRRSAGVPTDLHLHSLRHFQSTRLDAVVSDAQKQARLGWTTVHMARHYTDVVTEEDRKAAEHIGELLAAGDRTDARPSGVTGGRKGRGQNASVRRY